MIDLSLDEHDDGAVSQSGWVFADLLIALSVIFLATISFVPAVSSGGNERNSDTQIANQIRSQGFSKIYERIQVEKLIEDLADFRRTQGIPESVPLLHLQFVAASQSDDVGSDILPALEFSIALKKSDAWAENAATMGLSANKRLKKGQILVKAVFGTSD